MKSFLAWFGGIVGGLVLIVALGASAFGARWLGLKWDGFFLPREADVRRQAFENTRSFNEGKKQDLLKIYREYQSADDEAKAGLRSVVRMQFADYDLSRLDPELANFVRACRK